MTLNIYEHFACCVNLPVKLHDVAEFIIGTGRVQAITRYPVTFDPPGLRGALRVFRVKPPYAVDESIVAHILYSQEMSEDWARIVVVKEMMHLLSTHAETTMTRDQVSHLINYVILPTIAAAELPVLADKAMILHALCLLLPRDALDDLRPAVEAGKMSVEDVAHLARVPVMWARTALSVKWQEIVQSIK